MKNTRFKMNKIRRSILKSAFTIAASAALVAAPFTAVQAADKVGFAEKEELKFGFINGTTSNRL